MTPVNFLDHLQWEKVYLIFWSTFEFRITMLHLRRPSSTGPTGDKRVHFYENCGVRLNEKGEPFCKCILYQNHGP